MYYDGPPCLFLPGCFPHVYGSSMKLKNYFYVDFDDVAGENGKDWPSHLRSLLQTYKNMR